MNKIDIVPISIQRESDSSIAITWSDGGQSHWTAAELRKACPCATCREKRRGHAAGTKITDKPMSLPVLSIAEAQPMRIESMRPVGNYAYSIAFSDGHSSGVFLIDLLRQKSMRG